MDHIDYINYRFSYTPSKFAEENLIVCDNMGYTCAKDFFYDRETFDNNLVLCVLSGTFYVEQYGKKHILKAGQGILMKLTDHHKYYTDKKDIAHFVFFHFRGNMVNPSINSLFEYGYLPVIFNDPTVAYHIYHCFDITYTHHPDFEYDLSALIYQTILELCKPFLYQIHNDIIKANSWFVDTVIEYVDNHIFEKIDLEQLSGELHMSKFYFSKLFRQFFSVSPMQFVLQRKINLSMKLLANTKTPLNEIAHALCFSDQSHFTKTFKKQMGISPIHYRQMLYKKL